MAVMKSPGNTGSMAGSTRPQPAPVKNQPPARKQYRESSAGHSGRTSSGKGLTGAKAGRGSCTGY